MCPALGPAGFRVSEEEPGCATPAQTRVRPQPQRRPVTVSPVQQWFSLRLPRMISQEGSRRRFHWPDRWGGGGKAWSSRQQASIRVQAGGGVVPGVSRRRPYKDTGRGGASAVPGPRASSGEPGYLPGPRARPGPRTASPDQPQPPPPGPSRPPGPAPPNGAGAASYQAWPSPTQPSRSPPARGPGSDFAPGRTWPGGGGSMPGGAPGAWAGWHSCLLLKRGIFPFCREI